VKAIILRTVYLYSDF